MPRDCPCPPPSPNGHAMCPERHRNLQLDEFGLVSCAIHRIGSGVNNTGIWGGGVDNHNIMMNRDFFFFFFGRLANYGRCKQACPVPMMDMMALLCYIHSSTPSRYFGKYIIRSAFVFLAFTYLLVGGAVDVHTTGEIM